MLGEANYIRVMNEWFWLYIVVVPILVFSATPHTHWHWRVGRLLVSIVITYLLMNLAVHLKWDVIHTELNALPNPSKEDFKKATTDGANLVFTRVFGWLLAVVYVGWWEVIWRAFYRNKIEQLHLRMPLSTAIICVSMVISIAVGIFALQSSYPTNLELFFQILLPPSREITYPISLELFQSVSAPTNASNAVVHTP